AMEKTVKRRTDHDVMVAQDGHEAKRALKNNIFDLVITDIIMPDIEGFELITHITNSYKGTKVIAISGGGKIASNYYLMVAEKIGAEKIVKKPFSGDELLDAIKQTLNL
ncbi:MAG: response regulator, partial [Candidatus Marinimicrobia bacterium]|nr:response regulator [Candidatus Neomarinimicrobiota bacterium]